MLARNWLPRPSPLEAPCAQYRGMGVVRCYPTVEGHKAAMALARAGPPCSAAAARDQVAICSQRVQLMCPPSHYYIWRSQSRAEEKTFPASWSPKEAPLEMLSCAYFTLPSRPPTFTSPAMSTNSTLVGMSFSAPRAQAQHSVNPMQPAGLMGTEGMRELLRTAQPGKHARQSGT